MKLDVQEITTSAENVVKLFQNLSVKNTKKLPTNPSNANIVHSQHLLYNSVTMKKNVTCSQDLVSSVNRYLKLMLGSLMLSNAVRKQTNAMSASASFKENIGMNMQVVKNVKFSKTRSVAKRNLSSKKDLKN